MGRSDWTEVLATFDEVQEAHAAIVSGLQRFCSDDLERRLYDVVPGRICDTLREHLARRSKHLAGLSFLLVNRALAPDDKLTDPRLIDVAVALEVRHTAILIHDDVVDGDTQRGNLQTVHKRLEPDFGAESRSAALFAGDALFALSTLPILRCGLDAGERTELAAAFAQFTYQTSIGQAEQLYLDTSVSLDSVSEENILDVHVRHMAATTIECSATLASIRGGARNDLARVIELFARPLAAAYQVQNDVASIRELTRSNDVTPEVKFANTSDIERRRRTVPMQVALERADATQRATILDHVGGRCEVPASRLASMIVALGSLDYCDGLIRRLFEQSRSVLEQAVELDPAVRTRLLGVHQFLTQLYEPSAKISTIHLTPSTVKGS